MREKDTFTHAGLEYDLTKIRELTKNSTTILVNINDLLWVLDYDKPNESRVLKAKLRYPLLCAKFEGKCCVVDGLHRLERYRRKGITVIPIRQVTDTMLRQAII